MMTLNYCELKILTKTILGTDIAAAIIYRGPYRLALLAKLNSLCDGHAHGYGLGFIWAEARVFMVDDPAVFDWKNRVSNALHTLHL